MKNHASYFICATWRYGGPSNSALPASDHVGQAPTLIGATRKARAYSRAHPGKLVSIYDRDDRVLKTFIVRKTEAA